MNTVKVEFSRRFADFKTQKFNLDLFANPFAVDDAGTPRTSTHLKTQYKTVGAVEFAPLLPESMLQLRLHATPVISMFGSTYSHEQMLSIIKLTKTPHRSCLMDQQLVYVIKVARAKDINPRINKIVFKKRCSVW